MISSRKKLLESASAELHGIREKIKTARTSQSSPNETDYWWQKDEYKKTIGEDIPGGRVLFVNRILRLNITENEVANMIPWAEDVSATDKWLYQSGKRRFYTPADAPTDVQQLIRTKLDELEEQRPSLHKWYIKKVYNNNILKNCFKYGMDFMDTLDYLLKHKVVPREFPQRKSEIASVAYFHVTGKRRNERSAQWTRDALFGMLRGIFPF